MYPEHFYHKSLRKINAVFGSIFNNVQIERYEDDGTTVHKKFTVPIAQAQKRSFLTRLREEEKRKSEDDIPAIGITLPRLSYEFVGLGYNADNKLQSSRYVRSPKSENDDEAYKMYNPVPYDLAIDLNMYCLNVDDALQITEQILPFFTPQLSITINEVDDLGVKHDIKIRLDGLDTNIDYEGPIFDDRLIVWTLNFNVSTQLYQPISSVGVIKRTIENIYAHSDETKLDATLTQEVNPLTADSGDVYTIDETIEEF